MDLEIRFHDSRPQRPAAETPGREVYGRAMTFIIGSGLSAMAAAVALVRRGFRPTIIDAGLTPDPGALLLKARLASVEPENWSDEDLESLRQTGPVTANGIPRKLYFGSDFTFRAADQSAPLDVRQASLHRSFAAGGFSNVWGAAIQSPPESELQDWPISLEELTPHYAAVQTLLCGVPEDPDAESVTTPNCAGSLRPSSQARALYSDLSAGRRELERAGIRFDYARLAVRAQHGDRRNDCRYCGLCLYGCPYDCRYSAAATLTGLASADKVAYEPGVMVERLSQRRGYVEIEARTLAGGNLRSFDARCVLLAAGILETTRIMLASLGIYDTPVQVRHSDIFTLPLLRYRAARGIPREELHTLCQLVAEIEDREICSRPIHLQFYGYNDLYYRLLVRRLGMAARLLNPALHEVISRLLVIFGYLHSDCSSAITLTLSKEGGTALHVEGKPNPEAGHISRAVARKLLRHRRCLKAIPVFLHPRLDLPGGGYHSGGTFPMRRDPGPLESDTWGSVSHFPGVHLVDASVLPTMPACPPAFTVMANAHRIASQLQMPHA